MAKLKDGTQIDLATGEVLEAKPLPPTEVKRVERTKSRGRRRIRVRQFNFDPSMTEQSQAKEADVNFIMSKHRYRDLPDFQAVYADMSDIGDLHDAHDSIRRAEKAFMQLPADVRSQFDNDPKKLIDFLGDSKNDEEAIELGFKTESVTARSKKALERSKNVEQSKPLGAQGTNTNSTPEKKSE